MKTALAWIDKIRFTQEVLKASEKSASLFGQGHDNFVNHKQKFETKGHQD